MKERREWSGRARVALCLLAGLIPLGACDGDTPTSPTREVTRAPAVTPAPTQTPTAGPLAEVTVTLVPATSGQGFRHAFTVHIDVHETRGAAITARYRGVFSPGDYVFPHWETGGGTLVLSPFSAAAMDVLVEHNADIPCGRSLYVELQVESSDGLTAVFEKRFDCTTGFWPL